MQVGIDGGQGSVTVPLAGVAHKIELRPTVLDFGIVLVGSTKERKLTVKNQGVTTVTLEVPHTTQDTASLFRVMLESSLVLAPGESKTIPVQISPTVSGEFTGTVRLMSGQALLELPAQAQVYTEEEYRQILKQNILATCQATEETPWIRNISFATEERQRIRNIYFVPGYNRDYLFYRMPCPTDEELDALFELLIESENGFPISTEQYKDFDPAKVLNALQQLTGLFNSLAKDTDGLTPADYSRLISLINQLRQDKDFDNFFQNFAIYDEFWSVWAPTLQQLLAEWQPGDDSWQLLKALLNYMLTDPNAPEQPKTGELFALTLVWIMANFSSGQQAVSAVLSNPALRGMSEQMNALKAIVTVTILSGAEPFQQDGLTRNLFNQFLARMAQAYVPNSLVQQGYQHYRQAYIMALGITAEDADSFIRAFMANPDRYANLVGGFISFVALAEAGWSIDGVPAVRILYGFIGDQDVVQNVHVIATRQVTVDGVDRKVTVFVHVEAKLGESEAGNVANIIEKITQAAYKWWRANQHEYNLGTPVTVLVAFNVEPDAVAKLEQALQGRNLQTPVLILYPENGQWQARCVGNCSDKDFLDAVAAALAQALGTPYSGGSENSLVEMLSKLEEAMELAQLAFLGMSPDKAWWLTYGVCGADLGCILNIAEYLKKELEEQCGGPCPVPTSYPNILSERRRP